MRTRVPAVALAMAMAAVSAAGQDAPYKVESLPEPAPESLKPEIRATLAPEGIRVLDGAGKPFVDVWLRASITATKEPGAPENAIQYGFLTEGQLLGAARFSEEGYDYRDQPIPPDVYTIRYGLQPVNGDHLGVSVYRDYALLVIGEEDPSPADLEQGKLEEGSATAAGSNHPAIFLLVEAPKNAASAGAVQDQANERWGLVLPLKVQFPGKTEATSFPVQMIFVGHGPL